MEDGRVWSSKNKSLHQNNYWAGKNYGDNYFAVYWNTCSIQNTWWRKASNIQWISVFSMAVSFSLTAGNQIKGLVSIILDTILSSLW